MDLCFGFTDVGHYGSGAVLSKLIASVSIAGIVLAFILAWYASHKIYSPVARLIKLCSGEERRPIFRMNFIGSRSAGKTYLRKAAD